MVTGFGNLSRKLQPTLGPLVLPPMVTCTMVSTCVGCMVRCVSFLFLPPGYLYSLTYILLFLHRHLLAQLVPVVAQERSMDTCVVYGHVFGMDTMCGMDTTPHAALQVGWIATCTVHPFASIFKHDNGCNWS